MAEESIHIGKEGGNKQKNISVFSERTPGGGMSAQSKLVIVNLVLFFIALNLWGYYLYKKGFFGAVADIIAPSQVKVSTSPVPEGGPEKKDSIFMLPGI